MSITTVPALQERPRGAPVSIWRIVWRVLAGGLLLMMFFFALRMGVAARHVFSACLLDDNAMCLRNLDTLNIVILDGVVAASCFSAAAGVSALLLSRPGWVQRFDTSIALGLAGLVLGMLPIAA
jgi:hypothetical protein